MNKKNAHPKQSDFIFYPTGEGNMRINVIIQDQTLWLIQQQIAELFGRDRSVITKHLRNIFESGELIEKSNVQKMHFAHLNKPIRN